jgi:hypothetical protein
MAKKLSIEQAYDGQLIQAIIDMNIMLNDIAKLCDKRLAYEDWPREYQIWEELVFITEEYRKRVEEAEDE